jgi:tetratricopeptide (TPR) repeat protein
VANLLFAPSNPEPVHSAAAATADRLVALCNDALEHHRSARFVDAIRCYRQILAIKPDLPEIYCNFGHALAALGKPQAAVLAFECAVGLKPDNPEALCNWGLALVDLGRFEEAEAKYRQVMTINPRFSGAYNNLGLLLRAKGRLAEARQAFEQAIRLAPRNTSYYDNLAAVRQFVADDPYLAALEALANEPSSLSTADQVHLHFALAKAYDNLERPESAFKHFLNGNGLKRQQIAYDEATTLGTMDRLRALIDRDYVLTREGSGDPSRTPIFIVGMTRSGTTLIEQILASHPQVFGAGEVSLFDRAGGAIRNALPGLPAFPDMMLEMSAEHFRTLGALYLEKAVAQAPAATRITDKMTVNFLYVGLIHLALPNATIIHAVRDPADTCLSCFTTHFTNANEHTYDLAELGRYYRQYRALMAHWHDVLPRGRILDVQYEDLVADLDGMAQRIVSHCGLPWDERCLDFHRTERPIRTASAAQARKPIYTGSVGRWRKYEAFLAPLLRELEPRVAA